MKIKMYLDFVCPYSYIGKHKLYRVIRENFDPTDFEIELASYQLNPDIESNGQKMLDIISENMRLDRELIYNIFENIKYYAESEGLEYNAENILTANTLDAHRLLKYANEQGLGSEISDAIMVANFANGEDISNHEVLLRIADETGLDVENAKAVLESDLYIEDVKNDMEDAYAVDMENTPVFIFNQKYLITGAQDDDIFIDVIRDIIKENEDEV